MLAGEGHGQGSGRLWPEELPHAEMGTMCCVLNSMGPEPAYMPPRLPGEQATVCDHRQRCPSRAAPYQSPPDELSGFKASLVQKASRDFIALSAAIKSF